MDRSFWSCSERGWVVLEVVEAFSDLLVDDVGAVRCCAAPYLACSTFLIAPPRKMRVRGCLSAFICTSVRVKEVGVGGIESWEFVGSDCDVRCSGSS